MKTTTGSPIQVSKETANMNRYEIRISGSGGQGIILAGLILGEALSRKRKYVAQSQTYGPEARGTACMSEVIISDEVIDYPHAVSLDLLVAMNQEACDLHWKDLKPSGILMVDSTLVKHIPTTEAVALPFTDMAVRITKSKMAANMAALGALVQLTSLLPLKTVEEVIAERSPSAFAKGNIITFRLGARSAKKHERVISTADHIGSEASGIS
jgi:2-oxoglutarate ferredoxin oxidoreductase subunit gamma